MPTPEVLWHQKSAGTRKMLTPEQCRQHTGQDSGPQWLTMSDPPCATSTEVWAKSLCAASKVSNYHNGMARVDVTPPKFVWRCVHLALYLVVAILMTIVEHRTVHVT